MQPGNYLRIVVERPDVDEFSLGLSPPPIATVTDVHFFSRWSLCVIPIVVVCDHILYCHSRLFAIAINVTLSSSLPPFRLFLFFSWQRDVLHLVSQMKVSIDLRHR